ncbi:MAG: hypothetical protein COX19_01215 [Desulfobacterales bacterium CG23_combo_of_CG06-09_8_20_14_all_51_8]|nr:MAG: hypothetical protein COX19_01215 [Desulfobacterales bacterium CG23_combo_of_CG06-09_8_20_14_all_51_8]
MLTFEEPTLDANGNKKDDDFGDMYQLEASYGYSKNLSFAIYAALIEPGDAFKVSMNNPYNWMNVDDDNAYELFFETNLKF